MAVAAITAYPKSARPPWAETNRWMALARNTMVRMESVQSPTHSQAKNFFIRMLITGRY